MSIRKDITVTVQGQKSIMSDDNIYIYQGDKDIDLYFTIIDNRFEFEATTVKKYNFTIRKPDGDLLPETSITPMADNKAKLTITEEMANELSETGQYDILIHLYDEKNARITIPEISFEVKKPLMTTNILTNSGLVSSAILDDINEKLTRLTPDGKYNRTVWQKGDLITKEKLNKIEYELEDLNNSQVDVSRQLSDKASKDDVAKISSGTPLFASGVNEMIDITKNYVNTTDGYLYIHSNGSWVKSSVQYQSPGIGDKEVTPIKTNFMNVGKNLFDKSKVTNGRFYNYDGQTASHKDWCYLDINVHEGEIYSFSDNRTMTCFYGSSNNVILGGKDDKNYTLTVPNGAVKVRVSCYIEKLNTMQVERGSSITTYEEFGYIIDKGLYYDKNEIDKKLDTSKKIVTTVIEVPKNFANLRLALESIKDSSYYNRYIVKLSEGVYDVKSYYTTEELANPNLKGILVPKYTKLIGIGSREKIVLKWINPTLSSKLSTINLDLTAELENVTVYGEKIRYAIHDDWTDRKWDNITPFEDYWSKDCIEKDWYRKIKNCYAEIKEGYVGPSYGSGNMSGIKWRFIDCIFKSDRSYGFSIHNNGGFVQSTYTEFENCRFDTPSDKFIRFSSITKNANNIINYAKFIGCKSVNGGKVFLGEESSVDFGTGCLFKVSGHGNSFKNADVEIITTDGIDYTANIDLI